MAIHEQQPSSSPKSLEAKLAQFLVDEETKNNKARDEIRQICEGHPENHMNPIIRGQEAKTDGRREVIDSLAALMAAHAFERDGGFEQLLNGDIDDN